DLEVKRRQLVPSRHQLVDAAAPTQQLPERLLTFEDDPATPLADQRRVADELEGIAQPLLGMHQERLAFQRPTVPWGPREVSRFEGLVPGPPAPFVRRPPRLEVTHLQEEEPEVLVRIGVMGVDLQRLPQALNGLLLLPLVMQDDPQVVVRFG